MFNRVRAFVLITVLAGNCAASAAVFEITYTGTIFADSYFDVATSTWTNNARVGQEMTGRFILNTGNIDAANVTSNSYVVTPQPAYLGTRTDQNTVYEWDETFPTPQFLSSTYTVGGVTTHMAFEKNYTPDAQAYNLLNVSDRHFASSTNLDYEYLNFNETYHSNLSGTSLPFGFFDTTNFVQLLAKGADLFDGHAFSQDLTSLPELSVTSDGDASSNNGQGQVGFQIRNVDFTEGHDSSIQFYVKDLDLTTHLAGEALLSRDPALVVDGNTNQNFSASILNNDAGSSDSAILASALPEDVDPIDFGIDENAFKVLENGTQLWDIHYDGDLIGDEAIELVFNFQVLDYTQEELDNLDVYHFVAGEGWQPMHGVVDLLAGTITVSTTSFSLYSVGGTLAGGTAPGVATPEPSILALMGLGLLGVGCARRRRAR